MTFRVFDQDVPGLFRDTMLDAVMASPGELLWLDVLSPTAAEIHQLAGVFAFHPLAIEDVQKRLQRPKVEEYPTHLFVVLYTVEMPAEGDRPVLHDLALFLTDWALVTVHREPVRELGIASQRWAEHCQGGLQADPAMLMYTIADTVVDGYFPCMDAIGDRIEDLEALVFSNNGAATIEQVFRLKRVLLELRRLIAPTRDVFNSFTRRELPLLGQVSVTYFQDVYDHVIRVTDTIDAYRDILSTIVDVHLTVVSNDLNQSVRTLTVASIILMTLALIAGVYGMNFEHMPELSWRYGYFRALALMAVIAVGLGWIFRRLRWW
ncbi:MAG TPA: magnesium/cobalt transporter CorA [Thermomicrobiales bacterium]|nr:magnesium/cobalt transporter CorA [Thermomicrobiales bacterium]